MSPNLRGRRGSALRRNGDVRLAYRVFGDSAPVMVWSPGWVVSNVYTIDEPSSPYKRLIDIVSRTCRLVMWDRRGTGHSDPAGDVLTLDARVDDLRAVIDALGVDRPVLVGSSEGGSISILFAARDPERVSLLALYATAARFSQDLPSFPWGFTPAEIESHLDEIDCHWSEPADERILKTVMFTDIVGSTEKLSQQGDTRWRHQLDNHDKVVDHVVASHDGVRANHTGDGIFALFDAPTRAARCALELVPALGARGIPIRVGIHTGECERRGTEWSGLAVHTGARIEAMASAGEILASRTVRDLSAGSGLKFDNLGPQRLRGLPEDIEVFRVTV
jgi:class 3 adenylate cyclase